MSRRLSFYLALLLFFSVVHLAHGSGGRHRSSGRPDRIEGIVTAVSTDQLTVRTAHEDRQVKLGPSTVIKLNGQKTTANVLQTGDKVEIQASKAADGTLTAIAIEVENDMDVSGVIASVSSDSITITTKEGDAMFTVTPDTVVLLHGVRTSTAALTAGMRVEIHWFAGVADARVARLIEVHTELVETEGTVTAISAESITVQPKEGAPVTMAITPDTVVRMGRNFVAITAVSPGSAVEVKSLRNADGTLTAVLIQIENPNDLEEIKGEVTAVSDDSITVRTGSGAEVTLAVNAGTIVRIEDQTATIGDVHTGDRVEIDATSDGTTLTAVRIKVENEDERFVEIKGAISAIEGSVLTVQTKNGPVAVSLTSTTTFRGGTLADLATGTIVEITARRNTDGSLEALNVEIEDGRDDINDDKLIEIEGTVNAVDASSITLTTKFGRVEVAIDAATIVEKDDKPATLADLQSGQRVEVKAQRNTDNTLLAKRIKIDD